MAKVFISYSRKDIDFAKRLTVELQKSELDFWIDWEGIPPTVDWWKEIEKGIEEADAFLFLISPDSVSSKICGQEIEYAIKNGKRIIPIVVRDSKEEEMPPQLRHLNWIFFRKNDNFNTALEKLLVGIHTDYEWVQIHRRLQVKALEWDRKNKEKSFLLRGKDLQDAELQLAQNTSKEPHPTDLQREYVFASQNATSRQRRMISVISIVVAIALAGLATFGFSQANSANKNLIVAETEKANAEANLIAAETARQIAVDNANAAATSESRAISNEHIASTAKVEAENALIQAQSVSDLRAQALASFSQEAVNNDPSLAALLALEAVRTTSNAQTRNQLLSVLQPQLIIDHIESTNSVYVVRFSPSGDQLAVGYKTLGTVSLWSITSDKIEPISGHTQSVYGMDFSSDGKYFASGSFDNTVILRNVQTFEQVGTTLYASGNVFTVAFSPDSKWLAAGDDDGKITIWDTSSGRKFDTFDAQIEEVYSLAFSMDGKIMVSVGKDRSLTFWDTSDFHILGSPVNKHNNFIYSVDFSPDGETLATAGEDRQIIFWNVNEQQPNGESLTASQMDRISSITFSPDGAWLASGSYDGQVILWDVNNRTEYARLPIADPVRVYSVDFSSDGTMLAVGDVNGTVTLWDIQTEHWQELACEKAQRNFSLDELSKYFPGEVDRPLTCPQFPAET